MTDATRTQESRCVGGRDVEDGLRHTELDELICEVLDLGVEIITLQRPRIAVDFPDQLGLTRGSETHDQVAASLLVFASLRGCAGVVVRKLDR